jgi:hypothetical protein
VDLRNNLRHFSSDEEYQNSEALLQELEQANGIGHRLYDRLVKRTLDPEIGSWDFDLYLDHHYLQSREPMWSHAGNYLAMHNPS